MTGTPHKADYVALAGERFRSETADHQLTVLRDDELYRHLRCQAPGSWIYGFDVVTWPGYLAYVGDAGDFLFTRGRDMFEFFRGNRPNPDYWSEKLRGPGPAQHAVMEFDDDVYQRYVRAHRLDVVDDWGGPYSVEGAQLLLADAGVDPFDMPRMERYSWQFLWACHAIPWAIAQYDTAAVHAR